MGFTSFIDGADNAERMDNDLFFQAQEKYDQITQDYDNGKISFEEYDKQARAELETMQQCLESDEQGRKYYEACNGEE